MEFKGTKGEWELSNEKEVNKHGVDFLVINFKGALDCINVYSDMRTSEGRGQLLPNAKLIAAAPDLLCTLQKLLNDIDMREDFHYDVSEAERAINKALN